MRAIRYAREGGPEVLELVEVDLPPPSPGEVTIRIDAIGVNFADIYQRRGMAYAQNLPSGLGFEAAGTITALGEDVTGWKQGDRVVVVDGENCYAEAVNVPSEFLIALPDDVTDEAAVALMGKAMTVEYLLERCAPVAAGETILFHAAAGGVGLIACQWAKALGLTMIGTVSNPQKAELAAEYGCAHVIDTSSEDFVVRVQQITSGKGVPAVFDSIGKDTLPSSLKCVARRGTLVSFGQASGHPGAIEPKELIAQGSIYLTRPGLADYVTDAKERLASANRVFDMVGSGSVRAMVGARYSLEDAAKAHSDLESRRTTGACVLIP